MSLLYIDGFDDYTTATNVKLGTLAPNLWSNPGGTSGAGALAAMPILGSFGMISRIGGNRDTAVALNNPRGTYEVGQTYGIGFHYYNTQDTGVGILSFTSTRTGNPGGFHLTYSPGGSLSLRRGGVTSTAIATSAGTLNLNVLYHIEVKIFVHATLGTAEVRVNGMPFVSITNTNTTSNVVSGLICFGVHDFNTSSSFTNTYYDNLYIWDETGTVNNDWLGERNVFGLLPAADLTPQDWTLSTGADAFELLNNIPPTPMTQYISSTDVGDISKFGFTDLAHPSHQIVGVQVMVQATKTDPGASELELRVFGDPSAPISPVQEQNLYFYEIWDNNPDGDVPWTPASVNSIEVEIEKTA